MLIIFSNRQIFDNKLVARIIFTSIYIKNLNMNYPTDLPSSAHFAQDKDSQLTTDMLELGDIINRLLGTIINIPLYTIINSIIELLKVAFVLISYLTKFTLTLFDILNNNPQQLIIKLPSFLLDIATHLLKFGWLVLNSILKVAFSPLYGLFQGFELGLTGIYDRYDDSFLLLRCTLTIMIEEISKKPYSQQTFDLYKKLDNKNTFFSGLLNRKYLLYALSQYEINDIKSVQLLTDEEIKNCDQIDEPNFKTLFQQYQNLHSRLKETEDCPISLEPINKHTVVLVKQEYKSNGSTQVQPGTSYVFNQDSLINYYKSECRKHPYRNDDLEDAENGFYVYHPLFDDNNQIISLELAFLANKIRETSPHLLSKQSLRERRLSYLDRARLDKKPTPVDDEGVHLKHS
ncbi:MAG: hypothetical protein P1U74_02515 [Legionellaceae bacterium]|nr:hypothetical protein [Legionellaceae bacterium]